MWQSNVQRAPAACAVCRFRRGAPRGGGAAVLGAAGVGGAAAGRASRGAQAAARLHRAPRTPRAQAPGNVTHFETHTRTHTHSLSLSEREKECVCVLRASISSSLILPLLLRPPRGCELSCPPPTESLCRLAHYSVNSLVSSHIREQYAQTRTLFKQNKHANRLYLWCRSQFGGLELCASTTTTISFRFQTLLCSSPAIHKPILSPIRNFFVLWRILPFLTIQN